MLLSSASGPRLHGRLSSNVRRHMTSMRAAKRLHRLTTDEVLRYQPTKASRATVRRHYAIWRDRQGLPARCDNTECRFHTEPLSWLERPLPLILDHVNGNNLDNNPGNLRYLCPNCDAQQTTRGGLNRGRVLEAREGTYVLLSRDGGQHRHIMASPGTFKFTGHKATVVIAPSQVTK